MYRTVILWAISALLFAYGVFNIWFAAEGGPVVYWLWAVLAMAGAIGLFLKQPWSQYVIYALALATIGAWLYGVWMIWQQGWPYAHTYEALRALLPGIALVIGCIALGGAVFWLSRTVLKKSRG